VREAAESRRRSAARRRPRRPVDPRERLEKSLLAATTGWLEHPAVRPILEDYQATTRALLQPLSELDEVGATHAIARLLDIAGVEPEGEWPNPFVGAPQEVLEWGVAAHFELGRILESVLAEMKTAEVPVDIRGELNVPTLLALARMLYWPPDWSLPPHEIAALYAVGAVAAWERGTGAPVLGSRHLTLDDERDVVAVARSYRAEDLRLTQLPRPYAAGVKPRSMPVPARVLRSREDGERLRAGMAAARAAAELHDLRLKDAGLVRHLGQQARQREDDFALGRYKERPILDAFLAASGWTEDLPSPRRLSAALKARLGG